MKKTICAAVLLLVMLFSLAACSGPSASQTTTSLIDFGKKYVRYGSTYDEFIVFHSDHTGYCEHYSVRETYDSQKTSSARMNFVWREASDGAIYLFKTETIYHEDHTDLSPAMPVGPFHFSEEFFVESADGSLTRYIKEGSELEKLLAD